MKDAYTSIRGYILLDADAAGSWGFATEWGYNLIKEYPIKTDTDEEIHAHVIVSEDSPRVFARRTDGSYFVRTPINPVYIMIEGELTDRAVEEVYSSIYEWLDKLRYAVKLEDVSITIRGDSLTHKYKKLEMDIPDIE